MITDAIGAPITLGCRLYTIQNGRPQDLGSRWGFVAATGRISVGGQVYHPQAVYTTRAGVDLECRLSREIENNRTRPGPPRVHADRASEIAARVSGPARMKARPIGEGDKS